MYLKHLSFLAFKIKPFCYILESNIWRDSSIPSTPGVDSYWERWLEIPCNPDPTSFYQREMEWCPLGGKDLEVARTFLT